MLRPRRCAAVLAIWAILTIQARINGETFNSSEKNDGVTRSDAKVDRKKFSPHEGERDTLIESGKKDKGKTHLYFDVGGVKGLEYLSARAKNRVTAINNVKNERLEGQDKKQELLRNFKNPEESRDGKDFVTSFAKARILSDGQATTESFNDSKDERNIESGSHGAYGDSTSTDRDEVGDPFFEKNPNYPIPRDDGKSILALEKTRFNSERGDLNFVVSPTPEYEMEGSSQNPEGDAVPSASAYPNTVEIRDNAVRQIGLSQANSQTEPPAILSEAPGISDESLNHHPRGEIYESIRKTSPNKYLNEVKKVQEPILAPGNGNGNETRIIESLTPDIEDPVPVLQPGKSSGGVEDRSTRIGIENFSGNLSGGDTVMTESRRVWENDDAKGETALDPPEVFLGGIEEVVSKKKFTTKSSETWALEEKVNRGKNSMSSVNKIEDDKNVKAEDTGEAKATVNRETDVNAVENRAPTTGGSVQNGVTEGLDFTVNFLGGKNNDGDLRWREEGRASRTAGGNKNNTSESGTEFVKLSAIDIPRYELLTDSNSDVEGKIVPNFVVDDENPIDIDPQNHREKNSLKYSNNAVAITAIPSTERLSDKYLWSKNKRGMKIMGEKPIRKQGGVKESTVSEEESPNVSSLESFIATSKTETQMDTGSAFYGEKPMEKVWDKNTRSKIRGQSERLFPEGMNLTGINIPNENKSPRLRAASDDHRTAITAGSDQTYPDNDNEDPLSTETPSETTLGIFQAFTQGLSPPFNLNPTDSGNVSRGSTPSNQWPVKHSAVVEGDLVLGGLMMVHEREDTVTCGPVMPQGGVQALEAMLYTLDWFNEKDIIPGVKIGAHILDDCDKDTYGLEMAVDFIKGSISNIDGAEYHCNKTTVRKVISGVVGAASSVTSIQVANLLRLFRIPQVSFFSTSPELSNKQRFEYFTRTIPSDHYQVKAMVDIIRKMNWSYVSIVYEESNYGIKAFEELEALFIQNNICIAIKEKLVKDSGVAQENSYDIIVQKLLTKPRARGCIIYGSDQEVAGLMRAVGRNNATGAFSWIGSDGWSARGLVSDGNEPVVEGTLSVQPQANPVKGFEEYFLDLTVENNRRNPWFVEFWENHFQCRYPNASLTPHNVNYTEPCTTKERLMKNDTAFENQLQFVSDAVMAFAYAFRNMHRDLCPEGKRGLCDAMKPIKGTELLKYLKNVTFEGLSGDEFRFDKNGDGPARYNIFNFKQVSPGQYKWVRVGEYMEGELRLNMSEIKFRMGHPMPPESVCSLPCEVGQAKKYVEGESCCWHCFNCTQYQIRHPQDEERCLNCPQGSLPDDTHSKCLPIPEEFLRPESGWAIGAMSFSATGILVTLFIGGVFLKHDDTPVVRASGRESSYVLLTGILLCYLVTFALVLRPNDIVCGIQRFGAGFCFTVVYAALLTKTNRISRIFNAGRQSAQRPPFTSPRSQLIICSCLVGVQILVNVVWMIIDPAKAMHHYPTKEDNLLVCNSYINASYMIAFAYPIILIVVCTVYAVLTRKIPEDYNESKHIGFTMYTTCVIWLAFVPLYFGTGNHVALRITSMSVTISLSASVTIACLFSPKLYIILIHPERNVRQSMMQGRYSTTNNSAVTGTNVSCMMAPLTVCAVTSDQNKAVKRYVTTTIDGSTQSDEHYEMEVEEDRSNGKAPGKFISRSTQASATEPELKSTRCTKDVIATSKDIAADNGAQDNKQTNNPRIGNGPLYQKNGPL